MLENVPRLAKHPVFGEFISALESAGYAVSHTLTRADDYGVPQARKRLVLFASLHGPDLPRATAGAPAAAHRRTRDRSHGAARIRRGHPPATRCT